MSDFPYLDGLERELVAAARMSIGRAEPDLSRVSDATSAKGASAPTSAFRARRMRSRRARGRGGAPLGLIASVLALLGVSAAALAATGVLTGSPVQTSHPSPARSGAGAPITSSARLLPISFPDPQGGLPWGMRSFRTTRGMICLQIGRLYDGEIGALVQGRFRPFSLSLPSWPIPRESAQPGDPQPGPTTIGGCLLPRETSALEASGIPATGYVASHKPGERAPTPGAAKVRWMAFGVLGPSARSATYELQGHLHTVAVAAGSGAFLIVLPVGAHSGWLSRALMAGGVSGIEGPINPGSPQGAVRHFTYDIRGHTCLVSRRGTNTCLPWIRHTAPLAPTRYLHQPIRVTASTGRGAWGASLLVSFRAPYAVASAESDYQVIAPVGCYDFGHTVGQDVNKDEILHVRLNYQLNVQRCGPKMRVQVIYTPSARRTGPGLSSGPGEVIVGETTIPTPK